MASLFGNLFNSKSFANAFFPKSLPVPVHWKETALIKAPLLAIDLELTGLDTDSAKITSMGWVQGQAKCISLQTAFYTIIRASGDLAQSPVIHGLTAKDLAKGEHVAFAVEQLRSLAETHLWVLHNASLDMQVLHRVACLLGVEETRILTLDTMLLELYLLNKKQEVVKQDAVTLENCRLRHGLPSAPNHNALDDALATLTLAFSQHYALDKKSTATIGSLLQSKAFKVFTIGGAAA